MYFKTSEFVPDKVYKERGEAALELMDGRIVEAMEKLREWSGRPMTVNSRTEGRNWSGLRTPECPQFSPYSQHTFGRAVDSVASTPPELFHKKIIEDGELGGKLITFIEIGIGWLHIDCRDNRDGSRLKLWCPASAHMHNFYDIPAGYMEPGNYLALIHNFISRYGR